MVIVDLEVGQQFLVAEYLARMQHHQRVACGILIKHAGATAVRDAIRSVARTGAFHGDGRSYATLP